VRPFGVASVLAGFNAQGKPQVYQIDPSGTYFSWKANAIGGKNAKGMREFLEKEWTEGLAEADALKLTVKTLLEVWSHVLTTKRPLSEPFRSYFELNPSHVI